jgi:hypothetical protein
MTALQGKARTAETYLAGLGASGALMGGAIVAFVMVVGIATFNAWPDASGLFTFSGGQAEVGLSTSEQSKAGTQAGTLPPLVTGAGTPAGSLTDRDGTGGPGLNGSGGNGGTGDGGTSPGGSGDAPAQQPTAPGDSTQQSGNVVTDTVSSLGNTVEQDTTSLGDTLNDATGTNLGDLVTGVGQTLNGTLQGVAGS